MYDKLEVESAQAFFAECCDFAPELRQRKSKLMHEFRRWCYFKKRVQCTAKMLTSFLLGFRNVHQDSVYYVGVKCRVLDFKQELT
jgi:hypothetical protein